MTVVTHPMYVTTCKRLRLLGLSTRPPAWGICQNQMSDQARTILVFNSIPLITALPKKGGCYMVGFWWLFNLFGDTSASLIVFSLSARLVFDLQRILFQRISSQKILFLQRVSKTPMRLSSLIWKLTRQPSPPEQTPSALANPPHFSPYWTKIFL